MATAQDVARIITGCADLDAAAAALTEVGLGVAAHGNQLLVGGTIGVQFIRGNGVTATPYWVVYDQNNPAKSKQKVPAGRKPDDAQPQWPATETSRGTEGRAAEPGGSVRERP